MNLTRWVWERNHYGFYFRKIYSHPTSTWFMSALKLKFQQSKIRLSQSDSRILMSYYRKQFHPSYILSDENFVNPLKTDPHPKLMFHLKLSPSCASKLLCSNVYPHFTLCFDIMHNLFRAYLFTSCIYFCASYLYSFLFFPFISFISIFPFISILFLIFYFFIN